jgi:hypothetical protein
MSACLCCTEHRRQQRPRMTVWIDTNLPAQFPSFALNTWSAGEPLLRRSRSRRRTVCVFCAGRRLPLLAALLGRRGIRCRRVGWTCGGLICRNGSVPARMHDSQLLGAVLNQHCQRLFLKGRRLVGKDVKLVGRQGRRINTGSIQQLQSHLVAPRCFGWINVGDRIDTVPARSCRVCRCPGLAIFVRRGLRFLQPRRPLCLRLGWLRLFCC